MLHDTARGAVTRLLRILILITNTVGLNVAVTENVISRPKWLIIPVSHNA